MSKKQTKIPDLMTPIPGETVHEYIEQRIKDAIDLGALKQSVASTRKDEDGGLTTRAKADAAEVIPPLRAGEPSAALSKMRNQYCLHFDDLMNAYAEVLARSCSHRSGIQAVVESLRDEIIPERMMISSQSVVHAADLRLFFREILGGAVKKEAGGSNSNASAPTCGDTAPAAVCMDGQTRARAISVFEYFSDPANITNEMAKSWHNETYCDGWSYDEMCAQREYYAIDMKEQMAAAMKAAKGGFGLAESGVLAFLEAEGDGKAAEGSPGGSPKTPAAVCIWTTGGEHGGLQPSCTDAWTFSPYVDRPYGCPHCAKPVEIRGRSK